jgi:hypothetical protein
MPVAQSGIPIILFVDPTNFHKFRYLPFTVHVVSLPLSEVKLYQMAMAYQGELPPTRNLSKDIKEYFALMNSKIEFVKIASELPHVPPSPSYTWVDFGFLKMIKDTNKVLDKLKEIHWKPILKMKIPGCWNFGRPFSVDTIHWRFCGTFFMIPTSYLPTFYQHSKNVLSDFCNLSMYKLTWETNVWTIIESCAAKDDIDWYQADHNDSIILNINL